MATNKPPKCTRNTKNNERVKCNWCNKKPMWGNNFTTHKCVPARAYMSYKIIGLTSVASMIKERLRIKVNGPPTSMFQPQPVRKMWLHKGHHMHLLILTNTLHLIRIREQDKEYYTSKIFN